MVETAGPLPTSPGRGSHQGTKSDDLNLFKALSKLLMLSFFLAKSSYPSPKEREAKQKNMIDLEY